MDAFMKGRQRLNELVAQSANRDIARFFALDAQTYKDGALPARTKELLGLTASLVLRCDDCVRYHLVRCRELGWSTAEVMDALAVALVAGGSITIPHVRKAVEFWAGTGDGPRQGAARPASRRRGS